jgi:hypothetical protein
MYGKPDNYYGYYKYEYRSSYHWQDKRIERVKEWHPYTVMVDYKTREPRDLFFHGNISKLYLNSKGLITRIEISFSSPIKEQRNNLSIIHASNYGDRTIFDKGTSYTYWTYPFGKLVPVTKYL